MSNRDLSSPQPTRAAPPSLSAPRRRDGLGLFYLLVFAWAWGVGLLYAALGEPMTRLFGPVTLWNPLIFVTVWSPTLLTLAITARYAGRAGLRELLGRIFRWRFGLRWYAIATLGVAALALGARFVQALVTHTPPPPVFEVAHWPQFVAAGLVMLVLDPGPIGEDPGWRGFALPRMLDRFNPTTAALLLGAIWTVWHLPAFLFSGMPQSSLPLGWFCVAMVSATVLMSWVTINARGAVIPAILMHWAFNRFSDLNPAGAMYAALAYAAAAVAVIVATRGTLSSAPRRQSTLSSEAFLSTHDASS
ncbi:MAG: CPBP family intramembrane metalloprotease [Phenylobacterium sp.]|uniref:CPBP family intramembrane glutamic endopeptidase n=1 Tax=Phenylobacterium sp. TaxID=1871053 RepID=UPI0025E1BF43|nr:type II CAAX endopeptidase family protein [Phenylobacterium sp.]MBI1196496.1 CPBP family intramembrane metalloprotease [Phenylobacterium sp.]